MTCSVVGDACIMLNIAYYYTLMEVFFLFTDVFCASVVTLLSSWFDFVRAAHKITQGIFEDVYRLKENCHIL